MQLDDRLVIEVEDDGIGFVEDTDRPIVARGLGLVSIKERASRLGGTFNILSRARRGHAARRQSPGEEPCLSCVCCWATTTRWCATDCERFSRSNPNGRVVSEVGDGREAVREAIAHKPDVAIIDVGDAAAERH